MLSLFSVQPCFRLVHNFRETNTKCFHFSVGIFLSRKIRYCCPWKFLFGLLISLCVHVDFSNPWRYYCEMQARIQKPEGGGGHIFLGKGSSALRFFSDHSFGFFSLVHMNLVSFYISQLLMTTEIGKHIPTSIVYFTNFDWPKNWTILLHPSDVFHYS